MVSTCMESVERLQTVHIGLSQIHTFLEEHGWLQRPSYPGEYIYCKDTTTQDEVRIRLMEKQIVVAVPIRNCSYLYASKFNSYIMASEFIEMHINSYSESEVKDS